MCTRHWRQYWKTSGLKLNFDFTSKEEKYHDLIKRWRHQKSLNFCIGPLGQVMCPAASRRLGTNERSRNILDLLIFLASLLIIEWSRGICVTCFFFNIEMSFFKWVSSEYFVLRRYLVSRQSWKTTISDTAIFFIEIHYLHIFHKVFWTSEKVCI